MRGHETSSIDQHDVLKCLLFSKRKYQHDVLKFPLFSKRKWVLLDLFRIFRKYFRFFVLFFTILKLNPFIDRLVDHKRPFIECFHQNRIIVNTVIVPV